VQPEEKSSASMDMRFLGVLCTENTTMRELNECAPPGNCCVSQTKHFGHPAAASIKFGVGRNYTFSFVEVK